MELAFIESLKQRLPPHPQLRLGVGDDAALLALSAGQDAVVTTDLLAEGTHFVRGETSLARIGRKALAVNLSDLAAMAAQPVGVVISLLLPRAGALELATGVYEGILPLAAQFHVAIAGGDTNTWDGPLVLSITAIGETTARGPLRRDGARPGDAIVVTGDFGGSRAGKQFDFTPRIAEALLLHNRYDLHAGMDVSDGLSLDLSRMCAASGCGAMLDLQMIPISPAAQATSVGDANPFAALARALGDGEDFELLLAVPAAIAQQMVADQPLAVPLTIIGSFIDKPGLWQPSLEGDLAPHDPLGYQHS
jgi:thiamine-monophosphate kinase